MLRDAQTLSKSLRRVTTMSMSTASLRKSLLRDQIEDMVGLSFADAVSGIEVLLADEEVYH